MRTLGKWMAFAAVAAIVVVAMGSQARADDKGVLAAFTLNGQTLVAGVLLDPGVYAFRATNEGDHVVIRVSSLDEMKTYAVAHAVISTGVELQGSPDFLTFAGSEPVKVVAWEVPYKGIRYILTR
jgi:hypothetical protein